MKSFKEFMNESHSGDGHWSHEVGPGGEMEHHDSLESARDHVKRTQKFAGDDAQEMVIHHVHGGKIQSTHYKDMKSRWKSHTKNKGKTLDGNLETYK